ncbi:hypothetical protein [Lewinella sp. W8]|uniref:hypothetical protein n=1 Tax=Lewinella sp. W8 TaxID=2528208 RepID=UPI0010688F4D|nr:hypothetical protein [Lewinella sp. W8]MTB52347.1 hypothetical protein [Lewinella sp. W8]
MKKILSLIFYTLIGTLLHAQQETTTEVIDISLKQYSYWQFQSTSDSLKSDLGVPLSFMSSLIKNPQEFQSHLKPEEAVNPSLFVQYAVIDQQNDCGILRIISISTASNQPYIIPICQAGNGLIISQPNTIDNKFFLLLESLSPVGLSNLRRRSKLREAKILSLVSNCANTNYGSGLNFDCIWTQLQGFDPRSRNKVFAILNNTNE